MIDATCLRLIMPRAPALLDAYTPFIQQAMARWSIDMNITRAAAFIAQLAHESGELRWMEEQDDGADYEGRKDLGNVQPGDGKRYKGRGPIQLTGRANYRLAGESFGLDLEGQPELAALPDVGFNLAGWFWSTHGLNRMADALDFTGITRVINGGINGLNHRFAYYYRALEVLGRTAQP